MTTESRQFYLFYGIIILIYSLNIGGNAIWTTHEAYYAEAVREMLESGTWSEFFFNYEPRFQKPPVTYWLMAGSSSIFGLSEFALRLPILLCSLFTVLVVYKLGKLLFDEKIGLLSMLIFSMSLQFVWFKAYASPEIPLTFLFTLSLYAYLKGLLTANNNWLYYSWIALGLTALTKGFPYILLFFAIVLIHRFLGKNSRIEFSKLIIGFLIGSIIGLSWPIYMIFIQGDQYFQIFMSETIGRATTHSSTVGVFDGIIFYPQTILWSFFPFSILFYYALLKSIKYPEKTKKLLLPIIWFGVFLVVFTFSSGKLPIYILQAHPAMAIIVGYVIVNSEPRRRLESLIWKLSLWLPGFLIVPVLFMLIQRFNLSWFYILLPLIAVGITLYGSKGFPRLMRQTVLIWGLSGSLMSIIFLGVMPWTEQFRPYKKIGEVIRTEAPDSGIPLYIEGRFLDNLPFFAGRNVYGGADWTVKKIEDQPGEKFVLLKKRNSFTTRLNGGQALGMTKRMTILWQGPIHAKGPEDHFFKFIRDCYLLSKGDSSRFANYQLIKIRIN